MKFRDLNARPVSYTHLRAHETVLDLVCRLLLEKKNTHTPNLYTPPQVSDTNIISIPYTDYYTSPTT